MVWATGLRPDHSWLHAPVFDRKGGLRHDRGVVDAPGLYVLGLALAEFFSGEQIRAIASGHCDGILTEAEQAMVTFARQIVTDATRTTQAQAAALRAHGYDDAEIFDIAATAAGRAFWVKLLDALGVLADSPFLALDEPLRRALTVGRPIDVAECVTMTEPPVRA